MRMYESETIELKEVYTPDLKNVIVAFANTNGGTIYIGVQDSGEIIGLENADFVMQQISNAIRDSIRPDISMFTCVEIFLKEEKYIIKLTVYQGTKKPYYLSDKGLKPSGVSGISKIISCYKGLPVQPKFENVEGAFRVILPNTHAQSLRTEDEKYLSVLRLFEKQKEITRNDVEQALGGGTTHAINTLKEMISNDLINKVGSGRLTRYMIK